ncbi:MAG: SLBB domain-containing protein [Oscillospiraceae bacterium]
MELKELRSVVQNSGVVGAGGAGFPTYQKFDERASTILLNCAECEPLLKLHQQLLEQHTPEILRALDMVAKTLGVHEIFICVKSEYESTVQAVNQCLSGFPEMQLKQLGSVYPTGDEVVLIYEATGRVVRPGGLPIEVGALVFNVETMYNIYRAVYEKKPVTEKLVTVVGEVKNPITLRVPIGTPLEDLMRLAGGATVENPAYLVGGPMMGRLGNGKQPVTKTTNALLVLPQDHQLVRSRQANPAIQLKRAASACCQCQVCTDLCPRHALGHPIQPHLFMRAAANNDFRDQNVFLNTMFCCGCSVCEKYACPQSLSPASLIGNYKAGLRKAGVAVPKDVESDPVSTMRPYRTVPEKRLAARIGLAHYPDKAPMDETPVSVRRVKILFSQHIGAPAKPMVAQGDRVSAGDMIAAAGQGLSVAIHASITGKVLEVNESFAILECENGGTEA